MAKQVTSREYKLMLNTSRFQDRKKGIMAFWDVFKYVVIKSGDAHRIKIEIQDQEEPLKERFTWYMDTTPGKDFNGAGWVLRIRKKENGEKKFKTTLKYRSPDYSIAASKDLSNVSGNGTLKFEEDVTPAFSSKFSHSTSVKSSEGFLFNSVGEVTELFPGVKELKLADDITMQMVNDFTAHEVVCHVGYFDVGDDDTIKVKCCFSFWYLTGNEDMYPLAVEFSFDYDRPEDNDFPLHVCEISKSVFTTLQKQSNWVDLNGTTKTAFAYSGF